MRDEIDVAISAACNIYGEHEKNVVTGGNSLRARWVAYAALMKENNGGDQIYIAKRCGFIDRIEADKAYSQTRVIAATSLWWSWIDVELVRARIRTFKSIN